MRLPEALAQFDVSERHSIGVAASPEETWRALLGVTPGDAPLLRRLFRLRGLPAAADRPLVELLRASGFRVLHDDPPRELVLGLVGRPWRPGGGIRSDVADFAAFAERGYAKMGMDLRVRPDGGGARIETETRVALTDAAARRRFRAYWLVVRPFSGLVRRSWLAAAKRRAER